MSEATRYNIKRLLDLTGATHAQIGKIGGVTRSTVSHWVSGKSEPRMGPIQRIADYYGLVPENLTNEDGMRFVRRGPDGRLYDDTAARVASLRQYVMEMDPDGVAEVYPRLSTVGKSGSASSLTDHERELLSAYRSIGLEAKVTLLNVARALRDSGGCAE